MASFYTEDGGNRFLRNICTYLPEYFTPHSILMIKAAGSSETLTRVYQRICCHFYLEDGSSTFFGNIDTYPLSYTASLSSTLKMDIVDSSERLVLIYQLAAFKSEIKIENFF
jgi:hypothetical protein